MKKIEVALGALLLILISQDCGNLRSQKITTSNVDEVAKHVANSSLTDKNKQLFVGCYEPNSSDQRLSALEMSAV